MIIYLKRLGRRVLRYSKRLLLKSSQSSAQLKMTRLFYPDEVIDVPSLETNLSFSHFSSGMEKQWIDLLNQGGDFGKWDDARFARVILPGLFPEGSIFIIDGSKLVACSATCLRKEEAHLAILMYVLVLPQYRGHNLSFILNSEILRICHERGLPGITLLTDDFRLPAIRTYLKLGFQPDINASFDAPKRWAKIFSLLDKKVD